VELIDKAEGEAGYRRIVQKSAQLGLRDLDAREAHADYVSPLDFARCYAQLRNKDKAIEYLGAAFDEGSPGLVFLNVDPVWESMRGDLRFRALKSRMAFPSI
jgi:hypothetical protein